MIEMAEADERRNSQIRKLAEAHIRRHVSEEFFDYERRRVDEIVERIKAYWSGAKQRPYVHYHAETELGACRECDSAFVLARFEDDTNG